MRPAPLDIVRTGDLGGQKIGMTINVQSLDKIMTLLTDLYSDPAMAVIREYSTNARDAHVAAGNPAPIEVTTPNGLHPFFRVKDYGVGMSLQDLEDTYSQYGASTKTDSDDYNGMLGLGCKSALTFTQQFSLISVHNGLKIAVSISRIENGTGQMEVVDTKATDEPNSVEIIIPVANTTDFNDKVKHFYQFWQKGTVLIDGVEPEFIGDVKGNLWIDDDIVITTHGHRDYIVMGNVAYPTTKLQNTNNRTFGIVAFVEIGAVQFPPSRESLHYTDHTLKTVEKIRDRVEAKIAEEGQAAIDACKDYEEAEDVYFQWKGRLPNHTFNYKGLAFKTRWEQRADIYYPKVQRGGVSFRSDFRREFLLDRSAIVVTGFTAGKITPATRTKTRMYIETLENPDFIRTVIYLDKHPDKERLLSLKTVDWEVIKAFKIVRKPKGKQVVNFTVLNDGGDFDEMNELDDGKETVYIGADMWKQVNWYEIRWMTRSYNVVKLYVKDKEEFKRLYPDAVHLVDHLKAELIYTTSQLTDLDKVTLAGNDYYEKQMAQVLNPDEIDDPNLAQYIRNAKRSGMSDSLKNYQRIVEWAKAVKISVPRIATKVDSPFKGYPLARHATSFPKHATIYINTIYALKNGDTP